MSRSSSQVLVDKLMAYLWLCRSSVERLREYRRSRITRVRDCPSARVSSVIRSGSDDDVVFEISAMVNMSYQKFLALTWLASVVADDNRN